MRTMSSVDTYDVIIVGTGQSGMPLAHRLGEASRETAIIERRLVGGTCINDGCTPTKTMIASARVAHLARRAADYGVYTGHVEVSLAEVRQRKREVVKSFRGSDRRSLEEADYIDLIMGEARFSGPRELTVDLNDGGQRVLRAETIVINTGARARYPRVAGLQDVETLDHTTIMELEALPEHLLVLGGGYVGTEFGQMFRRFGSQVTIIQRGSQILKREDPDVAEALTEILEQDGVEVMLHSEAKQAELSPEGGVELTVSTPEGDRQLSGSHLLVATGRIPNTDALRPENGGVERDEGGHIRADDELRTTAEGVYAMGDVKGGPAFTHISYDDYRILADRLLEGKRRSTSDRLVPYTIFTDPQLGRVGLTERQAEEQGRSYRVAKMPMAHVARAIEVDETRGLMKAVVDRESDEIIGCAILGIEGGEIMGAIQIAMMGGLPYTALRDGVFAHPTLLESLNNLFNSFED